MTRKVLTLGGMCAALLLSGCGSGSSSSGADSPGTVVTPPTTTPPAGVQGSWRGTINSPTPSSRPLDIVVLDNGTLWMVYATANDPTQTDAMLNAAGLIQGSGTPDTASSSYHAGGAREISLEDNTRTRVDIDTTFVTGSTLSGSITRSNGAPASALVSPASFSSLYRTAYNNNLTLAHLVGTYQGSLTTNLGKHAATLSFDAAGAVTGNDSTGCTISGSATPRSRGNVFNLTVAFGNEPGCAANAATTLQGIVSLEAGRAGAMAMDAGQTQAFIFVGNR